MNCPRCQADNPVTVRFCQRCGGPLAQAAPLERCPKCQAAMLPGSRFCMHCSEPRVERPPAKDTHRTRPVVSAPAPALGQARPVGGLAGERRLVTALHARMIDLGLPNERGARLRTAVRGRGPAAGKCARLCAHGLTSGKTSGCPLPRAGSPSPRTGCRQPCLPLSRPRRCLRDWACAGCGRARCKSGPKRLPRTASRQPSSGREHCTANR